MLLVSVDDPDLVLSVYNSNGGWYLFLSFTNPRIPMLVVSLVGF